MKRTVTHISAGMHVITRNVWMASKIIAHSQQLKARISAQRMVCANQNPESFLVEPFGMKTRLANR